MRKTFIVLSGMAALAGGALLAQDKNNESASGKVEDQAAPRGTLATGINSAAAARQPAGNPTNQWRYRYHNGQWWYYHPSSQWSYWNGNAWTRYDRQTYRQPSANQVRPYTYNDGSGYYGYGRRPLGTIQREKNDARDQSLESMGLRPLGTIQRQKNDDRDQSLESLDLRPPGTIQSEKNDARAR